MDPRVIQMARDHMREEIGHAQMFADSAARERHNECRGRQARAGDVYQGLFGYLTVTIQYENEFVSNVAICK